jgi:hypothetical protein
MLINSLSLFIGADVRSWFLVLARVFRIYIF